MSQRHSVGSVGDQAPLLLAGQFASDLQLDASLSEPSAAGPSREKHRSLGHLPKEDLSLPKLSTSPENEPKKIILSTQSEASRRRGTQQLIPKGLAVASRPKQRYHTTGVSMPMWEAISQQEKRASVPAVSWEDYDADDFEEDGGGMLSRNRRNQSYRAAVKGFHNGAPEPVKTGASLKPVQEERAPSPRSPSRSKKSLGRKRNAKHGGSFKDEPRLYQEIRERGLHSSNQDPDDDFVHVEQLGPDEGIVVKNYRPTQLTWSQLPEVQERGILDQISPEERKRQEAIFEIILSEHSYQHSLNVLVRLFKKSKELRKTMNITEHHHLFSNISDILEVSKRFFADLEKRHGDDPLIRDISDIVENHASTHFKPYIIYCSNEVYQQRTLQKLLASNTAFKEALKHIEMTADCGGLSMISFLILPMQRVTRLPLLMDTICQKTSTDLEEYHSAVKALKSISKLVKQCNDGARRMERTEQMYTIQKQMEFGKIKPFPLVSASRWLQKRGELAVCTEELSIFWKAFSNKSYYLFLFNDVLIVTRKKSEESYLVMDYATLEQIEVQLLESSEGQLASGSPRSSSSPNPNMFKVLMKRNSEGKEEQIALVAESPSDRARWVIALQHHKHTDNDDLNKEDLPQVEIIKGYRAKQPDELSLQQADVVLVLHKVEGWFQGERLRDGERGWFPSSCATEITNRIAVERNVRRMERLRKETDV
ncbi:rho guanine nucleotide exchange factor 16-like [Polyodon spathula]|uniref:rho guanine nucleotide exchange factor 16-like n=1 Tax=Polyodon spathula TaxID=7913 RepID=UPI001B7D9153|nr:rho guanine nucleotide exchange factor 16-like [Polyodon spathula]XP_041087573.1 rho guanine nucleotide exchange factor 16-like [Polyodon spathula]XP_041087574.1 rho guanine nucleotide exchange factor 16-like [Polyodon spathula]XP_041087575.1 rho guanine nucleotide exchange factor 16-like [Polyodon spathula]